MKNKNTAALLAFVSGFAGGHQFYLGNFFGGMLFIFLMCWKFKWAFYLAIIQGIIYLVKSNEDFDKKYNYGRRSYNDWGKNDYQPRQERNYQDDYVNQRREQKQQTQSSWNVRHDNSPFIKEGVQKYKDYDFKGAIIAFEKAMISEPTNVSVLFNLACCHSCLENKDAAFDFLSRAVKAGLKDVEKIKSHDGLAFLRVQPEWDNFVTNDYRL